MPFKIQLEDVSFRYDALPVLRSISLEVASSEVVIIGGRSGYGKSTLLEIIAGILKPQSGKVYWDGKDVATYSARELLGLRKNMGYVFQQHALISNHTVYENIALPLKCHTDLSAKQIDDKVRTQMDEVGIFGVDKAYPEVLSMGQLKAVAVARALIGEPDLLFLDEPLSGVDPVTAEGILNVLQSRWTHKKMTILIISHSLTIWQQSPCRRFLLDEGRLEEAQTFPCGERQYGIQESRIS